MAPRIQTYKHGRIVIDDRVFEQDLVICGERIHLCWQSYKKKRQLGRKYIKALLEREPQVLIIGLGAGAKLGLTKKAIAYLEESGIEWHALPTKQACKLYNRLSQDRRVVAVLHLES